MQLRVLCVLALGYVLSAQDAVKTKPEDDKVEIDNPWVRVLRVKHPGHAKIAMHEHPASVSVFLTDVHQKMTGADGVVLNLDRDAGEVSYSEASKQAEENLSDQPLEAVLIELKPLALDGPVTKSPPGNVDPVKVDAEHHLVLLENDHVRVIRTILEPHLKSPMHDHPHYVVVYLTDLHTTMKMADGRVVDNPRKPGDIAWRDALTHQTVQEGDQTAVEIQVEIK